MDSQIAFEYTSNDIIPETKRESCLISNTQRCGRTTSLCCKLFQAIGNTSGTILADYIVAARNESNIADRYRKETIKDLFVFI
jgi:hypothetical protein